MSYKIISKFIKDISFEIPNAETFVLLEKEISKYNLNFDIKSKPYKDNIIEVNTVFKISPNQNVKHKILTEITGTALVSGISAGADDLTFVGDSYNALWDKSASSFHFLDSAKAVFGTGSDLSLYHDSNNSALTHNGTGDFYIQSDQFYFRSNTGGEIYATATLNGAVTLYYDNSAKVATTSAGISITGTVATTGNIELGTSATLIFEGSTANAHETILTVTDPTADRTITLPNATGTVITSWDSGSVTSEMIADVTIVTGDIDNGTIATVDLSDN